MRAEKVASTVFLSEVSLMASLLSGRKDRLVTQGCCRMRAAVGRWLGSMCSIFCTRSWGGGGRGEAVRDWNIASTACRVLHLGLVRDVCPVS